MAETVLSDVEAPRVLRLDLDALKLRPRRGHDLRRAFITLAQVARANC